MDRFDHAPRSDLRRSWAVPGAPHLAFVTIGLVITVLLDGAVIWIERSEYLEQSEVLRAAAGSSSACRRRLRRPARRPGRRPRVDERRTTCGTSAGRLHEIRSPGPTETATERSQS